MAFLSHNELNYKEGKLWFFQACNHNIILIQSTFWSWDNLSRQCSYLRTLLPPFVVPCYARHVHGSQSVISNCCLGTLNTKPGVLLIRKVPSWNNKDYQTWLVIGLSTTKLWVYSWGFHSMKLSGLWKEPGFDVGRLEVKPPKPYRVRPWVAFQGSPEACKQLPR